ncbi:LuxR C-terminal-related transcriptional regulator [Microbacterium sp. P05]|uniref:LuxR C-terminal-related transcriptional regulator n=1 Tax=Microbacterium sp. P05 TaxID=3366948 RepID=UPI003744C12D
MDSEQSDVIIGADRDLRKVVEALLAGTNIVLSGPLGSGKTHFLRELTDRLAARGRAAVLLRPGGPIDASGGALDECPDPRAAQLLAGRPVEGERPIVLIDDAQALDAPSVAAVVRAVYAGQATALFALTVTREGSTRPVGLDPDAAQMAIDLWLRGLADRVDLLVLTPGDANRLLDLYASAELDDVTRAGIVALADGSRMLLREMAKEASRAHREGVDPLDALRDTPPHSRLSHALAAHVAQLPAGERMTLAVLGRVARIGRADAVRFLPPTEVDALIAARLVYDDNTPVRRLTANAALAREAARQVGGAVIDGAIGRAAARMLASSSQWWCPCLAVVVAEAWLLGATIGLAYADVDAPVRVRVALDAARQADDEGDGALAQAYVRLGLQDGENTPLRVEQIFAEAVQGRAVDVSALIDKLTPGPLDTATLLRCVRIAALSGTADADQLARTTQRLGDLAADPEAAGTMALLRVEFLLLAMRWTSVVTLARAIFDDPSSEAPLRTRAAVLAGLGQTCLGAWEDGQEWFRRAHRQSGERGGISPVTTGERLWAISMETIAVVMTGTDLSPALRRLPGEIDAAARQGDLETRAMAGLILATAYSAQGDTPRAARELRAAVRRARPPAAADWVPFARIAVTRSLALSNEAEAARKLLDETEPALLEGMPALAHARMVAETYVAAALGRSEEALRAAKSASEASTGTPTMHAQDLFRLIALGDSTGVLAEMEHLAARSEVPSTRVLTAMAASLVGTEEVGGEQGMVALLQSTGWGVHSNTAEPPESSDARVAETTAADPDLTRRELEIALLVAEGLSNRQIAHQLFLSVRTVESHVYQARAKLVARSRSELGRVVLRHVQPATEPPAR